MCSLWRENIMKTLWVKGLWNLVKRRTSVVLIICLLLTNLSYVGNVYADDVSYQFVDELEIEDSYIDEGMFYMPHRSLEVTEGDKDKKGKYVFKVKRKGNADKEEKVKLAMLDISGKYDRDYSVRVIDKLFFSENVQNKFSSKSIDELLSKNKYEEYNYSDAIVNGVITSDDIMTDEEQENYNFSDEEKENIASVVGEALSDYGLADSIEGIDLENETVSGFTNSEGESTNEEEQSSEAESSEIESSETESSETESSETESSETESSETESSEKESSETESSEIESTETESSEPISSEAESSETESSEIENTSSVEQSSTKSDLKESTTSEIASEELSEINNTINESTVSIIYGNEVVEFEKKIATMSISEGYEIATGLKDDKKEVKQNRSLDDLPFSPNSLDNKVFMHDGIEAVEEGLNSAYIILEFKEGQSEKLIEVSILNDNKYRGDRQVGFSLSGVDGSQVAGVYSTMTLIIHDDEDEVPTYINFTKAEYLPNDGYVTVDIERSGELSSMVTCMIDSEDITAKEGKDYSKVHAKLVFGMGANKRTVKIPIMSEFISGSATFKLKLQEPVGALIGDKGETICRIRKSDENFKYAKLTETSKILTSDDAEFGSSNTSINVLDDVTFGAGGRDYDLDSVVLGKELNLKDLIYNTVYTKSNSNSYARFENNNKGYKVYVENHDFFGETADIGWGMNRGKNTSNIYGWSGVQIKWSVDSDNNRILVRDYDESTKDWKEVKKYTKESWGTRTDNLMFNQAYYAYLWFNLYRYDGFFRTSPTLSIESIKPIFKMYKIDLTEAQVPKLIDENGQSTTANRYAKYALTQFDGAKSDGTAIGWTGKTITVKFANEINNPFYIKALRIKKDGVSREVARNYDQNATSISFEITEDFLSWNKELINTTNRPGGGKNGSFTLYAELDTKTSLINIQKDNRVDIKIWGKTSSSTGVYHVGDVIHFTVDVKPEYKNIFKCDGINVYRMKPYSPEWITIRRPLNGEEYFPLDLEYSEIKIAPLISQAKNSVIVKIKKDTLDSLDQNYGFLATAQSYTEGDYINYYIETDSSKICGKYFELKARCKETEKTPVWYEAFKDDYKYAQNTYNFLGSDVADNNIIYLTVEKGDDIEYSITGTAYYEELPIGGKTIDKYWQAAPNVGIIIDDAHYAYADGKGVFATFPGRGKVGYYKQLKIVSNGAAKYVKVLLDNKKKETKTYSITYQDNEEKVQKNVYEVSTEEVLISNTQSVHPYVSGIKVMNMAGSSFGAVYINDESTILKANVIVKKPDGSNFTYSYNDESGASHEEVENVKAIEFVVVDKTNKSIKKVITATKSNADKTEWTVDYTFNRGKYNEYISGDKLYVRVVTDKKVGDGKGYDIEGSGAKKSIPIFNETTYQSVNTSYSFIEEAEKQAFPVNIELPNDSSYALKMPILGNLYTNLNLFGLTFSIKPVDNKITLSIGKKFKGKGNRYDGQGRKVSDTGEKIDLSNLMDSFSDMSDLIKSSGTERLKTMTLGVPSWMIEPTVGATFDFMLYHDAKSTVNKRFEFVGGAAYFGVVIDLRYTFYFLVFGFPFFVGGQALITLVAELGIQADANKHIPFNDPDQGFFDSLIKNSHFEFLIRAAINGSAYVGAGIAGTVGVRGGYQLRFKFIWNPVVPGNVRPIGFSLTGSMMFWIDGLLVNFSIPAFKWKEPLNLGYFEDIKNQGGGGRTSGQRGLNNLLKSTEFKLKPRYGDGSNFVANHSPNDELFGSSYQKVTSKTLIEDAYDGASPLFMKYNDNNALLVYVDDDKSNTDIERTELKYMLYDGLTDTWSDPVHISDDNTADFSPNLCDCGEEILLSWTSRYNAVDTDSDKKDIVSKMEVYATFFDKTNETFGPIERITTDEGYDYNPKAIYDPYTGITYLYYIKDMDISDIDTLEDYFDELQTEANGSYLMYMIYDDPANAPSGPIGAKHWVRDYYYDYEISSELTPEEKQAFIDTWQGQRFQNLSTGGLINNPYISDYALFCDEIYDVTGEEILDFIRSRGYNSESDIPDDEIDDVAEECEFEFRDRYKKYTGVAYVVEPDGSLESRNDTDIFLKLHYATGSEVKTIRVTKNNVSDMMPQIINTEKDDYLFWIQNESTIKMVSFSNLIKKATVEDDMNNGVIAGDINLVTVDNLILSDKINSFYPFVDNEDNVYIVWQQSSQDEFVIDDDGEISFNQDLYIAGLVETIDNDGNKINSWSKPIQLTNNAKINELPSAIEMNDKLILINSEYNFKSAGEEYHITNCNLQSTTFEPVSSLEVIDVFTTEEPTSTDNVNYNVQILLKNTGINVSKGFDYSGNITYDGRVLADINGSSDEYVAPGNDTLIGGRSVYANRTTITPDISITLTEDERHNIDKVKLNLTVVERGVGDSGISITRDLFDVKERFSITDLGEDEIGDDPYKYLSIYQEGDEFIIKGVLMNSGNIDSKKNERIYVISQDDWDTPIAKSDYIDLPINQQMKFAIPVDASYITNEYGIDDLVLYVMNDDKKILSEYSLATVDASMPYNFKVNDETNELQVGLGEVLRLNTTFEPSSRYRNANILYTVEDPDIVGNEGNQLFGLRLGTTKIHVTTKEFGGNKDLIVNVIPSRGSGGSSGSSGGGGGGLGPISNKPNITNIQAVKTYNAAVNAKDTAWVYDPINDTWQLNIKLPDSNVVAAKNGFYMIQKETATIAFGNQTLNVVNDTYYFDGNGTMLTGWIGTMDGKWYFFDDAKTVDQGKMVIGWKNILGSWYYFSDDGAMLVNAITPDGFIVGADGKWVQ